MNEEVEIAQKHNVQVEKKKVQIPIKGLALILLLIIIVLCAFIGYNYFLQNQLNYLREQTNFFNNELKQIKSDRIEDITVKQLAEKLDYVMNQQEVNVTTTQGMVEYMTFTFTIIGVFFLLISGYFVYRQQSSEKREEEGWRLAKNMLESSESREKEGWILSKSMLESSESREKEGWGLAKKLLDLVIQSQQFVANVQEELQRQQDLQKERLQLTEKHLKDTCASLDKKAEIIVSQFSRDNIFWGRNFTRLVDISNKIDNIRFQIEVFGLSLDLNCHFLKNVYEYIIGNYNTAKEEFDKLILKREKEVLNDTQKKQLSLCYYYRGLIEYNIQENLPEAENFMRLAVDKDPKINGPDFKSMLLKAEIKFKRKNPEAVNEFKNVANCLTSMGILTDTQNRLLSYAYLGMATCQILEGGKKFLPTYYKSISQLDDEVISEAIGWLKKSENSHIYTFLTLGHLSVVFENSKRNIGLEPSYNYFEKAYKLIEEHKPYETKQENRGKILAYSAKLVCEKFLNTSSIENTKLILKDLLNDRELRSVYSIFSKVNVSKAEYFEELKLFGISGMSGLN